METSDLVDEINTLKNRLERLEIEKDDIGRRITSIENSLRGSNNNGPNNKDADNWHDTSKSLARSPTRIREHTVNWEESGSATAVTAVVVRQEINGAYHGCTDRNGVVINLGDRVYMLTKGRFKERRGTVKGWGPKFLTIEDKTGREQLRIPKNVRVQNW